MQALDAHFEQAAEINAEQDEAGRLAWPMAVAVITGLSVGSWMLLLHVVGPLFNL